MAVLKVKNADGTWSIVGVPTDAVKYVSQVLTEAQKAQARENIGASAFDGDYNNLNNIPEDILKYTAQTLSDTQKEQARGNIGAAKIEHSHTSNDLQMLPLPDDVQQSVNTNGWYDGGLDNLITPGVYRGTDSGSIQNTIIVINMGTSWRIQLMFDGEENFIYKRVGYKSNSSTNFSWNSWLQLDNQSFVPLSRTVNNKSLSSNVTLTGYDILWNPSDTTGGANYSIAQKFDSIDNTLAYKAEQATTLTFTLTSSGWNNASGTYVQTVNLSSLTKVDHVLATVVLNDVVETAKSQQEAWNKISRISLASGSITAYCFEEAPTIDITVRLEVLG